jgi:ADP-ribose pyrophosphatase
MPARLRAGAGNNFFKMKKWKCKKSSLVYQSKHFRVKKDLVVLPNKELIEWTYWDSNDSAMVVAMTADKKLVMIEQFRYLVGSEVIEFPSGLLHKGEKKEVGARREFEEESGFKCGKLVRIGSFYETYGQLNRKIHIFFTNDITESKQKLDKNKKGYEDIKLKLIDYNEVVDLAVKNKILAMGSTLAILMIDRMFSKKVIKNN